jgi:hypothetical protein
MRDVRRCRRHLSLGCQRAGCEKFDPIKLGFFGCGNRGVGAVMDAVNATSNIEIGALAAFRIRSSAR